MECNLQDIRHRYTSLTLNIHTGVTVRTQGIKNVIKFNDSWSQGEVFYKVMQSEDKYFKT